MARREIVRGTAAGVQLIEIVHTTGRQAFSRYAVTSQRDVSRRDLASLRDARRPKPGR